MEREGEGEGKKHQCVVASRAPGTQACALTGDRTGNPVVHRPTLNPLSHTSQSRYCIKKQTNKQTKNKAKARPSLLYTHFIVAGWN